MLPRRQSGVPAGTTPALRRRIADGTLDRQTTGGVAGGKYPRDKRRTEEAGATSPYASRDSRDKDVDKGPTQSNAGEVSPEDVEGAHRSPGAVKTSEGSALSLSPAQSRRRRGAHRRSPRRSQDVGGERIVALPVSPRRSQDVGGERIVALPDAVKTSGEHIAPSAQSRRRRGAHRRSPRRSQDVGGKRIVALPGAVKTSGEHIVAPLGVIKSSWGERIVALPDAIFDKSHNPDNSGIDYSKGLQAKGKMGCGLGGVLAGRSCRVTLPAPVYSPPPRAGWHSQVPRSGINRARPPCMRVLAPAS